MSHVNFFFVGQSGEAIQLRVYYHRGLPRLVYEQTEGSPGRLQQWPWVETVIQFDSVMM